MLDGFGRADVLASYGYDAGPFVADLEARDFTVAAHSRSNYPTTGLAMTSLLNAAPISALGFSDNHQLEPRDIHPALEANRAFEILADAGYETIAFSSGYELVALRSANRFVDTGQLNELEIGLAESTILEPLLDALTGDLKSQPDPGPCDGDGSRGPRASRPNRPTGRASSSSTFRCRIRRSSSMPIAGQFAAVSHSSSSARMALPASRPAAGRRRSDSRPVRSSCVQRLAIEMVDGVLAGAGPDTVVLVLSDHGPETRLERSDPQPDAIHERLANLFAARTPAYPDLFPDDITLVNVLPHLVGAYLDVNLPEQPDTVYFGMPGVGLVAVESAP